jgi:hypothetical protein
MAISPSGIVGHQLKRGAFKGGDVASFIRTLDLQAYDALLIDNASIHKTSAVRDAANHARVRLEFLSPYSPEFQPIEHAFAQLKAHFRRLRPAESDASAPDDSVQSRLLSCMARVHPEHLQNMFDVCWRRAQEALDAQT